MDQRYSITQQVRNEFNSGAQLTVLDIVDLFGVNPNYARNILSRLRREEYIVSTGRRVEFPHSNKRKFVIWRKA